MTLSRTVVLIAIELASASPSLAASQSVISNELQQEALTCAGEAVQICPEVWTAPDHGLTCMTGKRSQFSPRCQVIYDKVDHALHPKSPMRSARRHERAGRLGWGGG